MHYCNGFTKIGDICAKMLFHAVTLISTIIRMFLKVSGTCYPDGCERDRKLCIDYCKSFS